MLSELRLARKVQNVIEHVREPKRLVLAWQAPDQFHDRFRWAVGELLSVGNDFTFRYFKDEEFSRLNQARNLDQLTALGYRGFTVFRPSDDVIYKKSVLSAFLRRLPPRSRSDFPDYMQSFCLSPDVALSDFALLGITEAKLPSDGFSLVDEFRETEGRRELMVELAGHRYYRSKIKTNLVVGDSVELIPEPTNEFDSNAIMVRSAGECIGYINRLQAKAFRTWLAEKRIAASLERLNGSAEKPRAYIFARISS